MQDQKTTTPKVVVLRSYFKVDRTMQDRDKDRHTAMANVFKGAIPMTYRNGKCPGRGAIPMLFEKQGVEGGSFS